jgi:hypothetical protein
MDTINYLEYVYLLKFLIGKKISTLSRRVEIEADEIDRKYEEHLKKKQDEENSMRQKLKHVNEIILLFNRRLF